MLRYSIQFFLIILINFNLHSQEENNIYSSSSIISKLEKLNTLGKVLYVAAHPDDENTRLITYLSNEKKYQTAYLSLTRGDGGQNLIGKDLKENLGLIRTQELLEARKIDGGIQFFTSAIDFGYSKNSKESLEFWNEDQILYELVWIIRKFKPDVIITRFNEVSGITHGHHTASSILTNKAFRISGNPDIFQDQLEILETWKAKRIFWNTSTRFFDLSKYSDDEILKIDVGLYNNILGKSYNEISSESRSMHKSQGFGSLKRRGSEKELFILTQGDKYDDNLMDGVDVTWNRFGENNEIIEYINNLVGEYDPKKPYKTVNKLSILYEKVSKIKDEGWKEIKLNEIKNLIKACLGLFFESLSDVSISPTGENIKVNFDAINRSPININLKKVSVFDEDFLIEKDLINNEFFRLEKTIKIPESENFTEKYWLMNKPNFGNYDVKDQELIGNPDNNFPVETNFIFTLNNIEISYTIPLLNKKNSPTKGDDYKIFNIGLPIYLNPKRYNELVVNSNSQTIEVEVISGKENLDATIYLDVPENIKYEPKYFDLSFKDINEKKIIKFNLTLPEKDSFKEKIIVKANYNDEYYERGIKEINYDHIIQQVRFPLSEIKIIKFNIKTKGKNVAYFMGSGDNIPSFLSLIGYKIDLLTLDQLSTDILSNYDALIIGIRAYNVNKKLIEKTKEIHDYVKNGGNVLVQYNTSRGIDVKDFAPYSFNISRNRTSQENSKVDIINKNHIALNYPNKILLEDFDNWVQERGLYFPINWSDDYETLISSNDSGEKPNHGGILISKIGKGHYVYTSYSWFRQLPSGVSGAYKLFVNLISLGIE
tara:strand:- start:2036 stop:4513 length:2478 start_codon:yes stop_codon:yes gene_type:complete